MMFGRVVEKGYDEPSDKLALSLTQKDSLKELKKRDEKALFLIYQPLDDDGFEKISSVTSAKLAWEKLQTSYKRAEQIMKGATTNFKRGVWSIAHEKRWVAI